MDQKRSRPGGFQKNCSSEKGVGRHFRELLHRVEIKVAPFSGAGKAFRHFFLPTLTHRASAM